MRISIVMPVKNGAAQLRRALDSVVSQDFRDFEVLPMDGGSTDDTAAIFESYGFPPRSRADHGPGDAINRGAALATGEILMWLMHDDVLLPAALRRIDEAFTDAVEWVYAPMDLVDNNTRAVVGVMGADTRITMAAMLQTNQIAGVSSFMRRATFLRLGGLDTRYQFADDYELWLRALHRGIRPHHLPERVAVYYLTGANRGTDLRGWAETIAIRKTYADLARGRELPHDQQRARPAQDDQVVA